jgi:hypothetical protein
MLTIPTVATVTKTAEMAVTTISSTKLNPAACSL